MYARPPPLHNHDRVPAPGGRASHYREATPPGFRRLTPPYQDGRRAFPRAASPLAESRHRRNGSAAGEGRPRDRLAANGEDQRLNKRKRGRGGKRVREAKERKRRAQEAAAATAAGASPGKRRSPTARASRRSRSPAPKRSRSRSPTGSASPEQSVEPAPTAEEILAVPAPSDLTRKEVTAALGDPSRSCFYYVDPQGKVQGPHSAEQLLNWWEFFETDADAIDSEQAEQFKSVSVWKVRQRGDMPAAVCDITL